MEYDYQHPGICINHVHKQQCQLAQGKAETAMIASMMCYTQIVHWALGHFICINSSHSRYYSQFTD